MAGLECVRGPAETTPPASSLCPKLIPVSFHTSAEQQAAVLVTNHCTAEFPFLSTCPSFFWKVKGERKQNWEGGLRHVVLWFLMFNAFYWYFVDRWENISTRLTKMETEVWPRRSGTRSSISPGSLHQCERKTDDKFAFNLAFRFSGRRSKSSLMTWTETLMRSSPLRSSWGRSRTSRRSSRAWTRMGMGSSPRRSFRMFARTSQTSK